MRVIKRIVFATLLFSFLTLSANAGEKSSLTLDEAIEKGLAGNPSIAAAYHEAQAAFARPPQAATPPDPEFMFQFTEVPINTNDVDQGMKEYMVEQQIPFPSKLVYGYKAEKRRAEALKMRETAVAQEVVRQIKKAYVTAWRLQEEENISRKTLAIYQQSKGVAETAFATLAGTSADPVRAAVDLGEIEGQLAITEQDRIQAVADLSSLILNDIDPETRFAAPNATPAVANVNELVSESRQARPEISEAQKMVASEKANVSKAVSQYAPDLTLRWGYIDMPAGFANTWTGRIGVSVPLWSISKQRFGVTESKAMLKRAESAKAEAEQNTIADVRTSYARLTAAKKIVSVYSGSVVPRARILLSSSQEAYRSKTGDFLGVVDAIRSLNNSELTLLRARADEVIAFADLERAVGLELSKENPYECAE